MKNLIVIVACFCCLPLGCAAFSEKAKMEKYGRTLDAYETAMRLSDLNTVCQFVDSAVMSRQDCLTQFGKIKLISHEILAVEVDKERLNVSQEIKVNYHFLNHYRIEERQYKQTWQYLEDRQDWFLQNGPPLFK